MQDNKSMSSYGVMRGLHFQHLLFTQSKLVRCVIGNVHDVAVYIRKRSLTYGQYVAIELSEDNQRKSFVLLGVAVFSETAIFLYKCDNFYVSQAEEGISIKNDTLCINW